MTVEVGGAGTLGIAFEATLGTYVPPTKWIPIRSETLAKVEDKQYRTNLRGLADRSGTIQGYNHVEGDIVFEVTPDILVYFLYMMRTTPAKTGAGPFVYTFTPAHVAKTTTGAGATTRKTASLLVKRGGERFGYVGMAVGQLAITVENGVGIATASMVGTNEETQATDTPVYTAQEVAGPGDVTLEIPTATARADADTFNFVINDNLVNANRLNGSRFSAYQNWGEREITMSYEIDFDTRTEYDAFIAGTIRTATLKMLPVPGTEEFEATLNATVMDTYPVNLAGLGDVNRAAIDMHAFYQTSDAYSLEVTTAEDIP